MEELCGSNTVHDEALAVCKALGQAGIWLELHPETQGLVLGPTVTVQAHPELLQQVREQKTRIIQVLQETLAYEVVTTPTSGRFQVETCPACQHPSFVVLAPRRLAVHRSADGHAVCPGAIAAQEAVAQTLMPRFITERCVSRPGSILTWMALRGGIEGWAREQGWLLPPRPYLLAWMDAHYTRFSQDEVYASWQGLTFALREWLGEDAATSTAPTPRPKLLLKA